MNPKIDNTDLCTESVRITVFWSPGQQTNRNYFRELFLSDAEVVNSNIPAGIKHYEGVFNGTKCVIDVNPLTFNIVLMGPDQVDPTSGVFLPPLKWAETKPKIDAILHRLETAKIYSSSPRIAFGPIVFLEANTIEEATNKLKPYLPFELGGSDRTDFIFQNNAPKSVKLGNGIDMKINRLVNVMSTQVTTMQVGAAISPQFVGKPSFRARFFFDYNNAETPGEDSHYSLAVLLQIFEKLRLLVDDTLSQGFEL